MKDGSHCLRLDLFCQVIDNYGDAGVCWRLARQLACEFHVSVRLWIDRVDVLKKICPQISPAAFSQTVRGVEVRHWSTPFPAVFMDDIPDVVVEGFGARLPENYVAAMAQRQAKPVWINLEYLSAESWVDDMHLLPSPQSNLPLTKHFFFPGFSEKTGGLIRERALYAERDRFLSDRRHAVDFLSSIGVHHVDGRMVCSMFCYPDAPLYTLLDGMGRGGRDILCLVPEGVATGVLASFSGQEPRVGMCCERGRLRLQILPMVEQGEYDRLLWSCDLNFVRGEDSFVRAQFAGKPFVWQIYPQEENVHMDKLEAFLGIYQKGMAKDVSGVLGAFWRSWNTGKTGSIMQGEWSNFCERMHELSLHACEWSKKLGQHPDLAWCLVRFINTLR